VLQEGEFEGQPEKQGGWKPGRVLCYGRSARRIIRKKGHGEKVLSALASRVVQGGSKETGARRGVEGTREGQEENIAKGAS